MLKTNGARLDKHWRELERTGALPAGVIDCAASVVQQRLQPALSLENARLQVSKGRLGPAFKSLVAAGVRYRPFRAAG